MCVCVYVRVFVSVHVCNLACVGCMCSLHECVCVCVCVCVCHTGLPWRCGLCVCVCVTWRCGLWFTRVLMTRARGRWGREKESKQRDALRRDDENYIIKQTERCGRRNKQERERERERERETLME